MKKPVIGLTPSITDGALSLPQTYLLAIENAGGLPVVLPHTASSETAEALTQLCDGMVFTGGPDVDPHLYGEAPWFKLGSLTPARDTTDPLFFRAAYKAGKPILGICRGIQLVNACMGGTLYQDLGTQFPRDNGEILKHRQNEDGYLKTHEVIAEEGSVIAKCYGATRFGVNTFHHQAVKVPAPGMKVTARATDGVIEGLEKPDYGFLVCVQWHPEWLQLHCEGSKNLFKALVDACR